MRSLTTEVVPSPVDADIVSVADGDIRSQEVTLVVFVVQVSSPDLITELIWEHLEQQKNIVSSLTPDNRKTLWK